MWLLVDKLVKGQKENLNETHYYLLLCQLTALLFIFHWMPSSLRRISTFRYILWKEYAAFASASTSFLNFTFCCTRSCFLAAQVYFIFSGHQSSVGLCSLENENTHPYQVVLNCRIQCNLYGLCLRLTLTILLLPLKPSVYCSVFRTVSRQGSYSRCGFSKKGIL